MTGLFTELISTDLEKGGVWRFPRVVESLRDQSVIRSNRSYHCYLRSGYAKQKELCIMQEAPSRSLCASVVREYQKGAEVFGFEGFSSKSQRLNVSWIDWHCGVCIVNLHYKPECMGRRLVGWEVALNRLSANRSVHLLQGKENRRGIASGVVKVCESFPEGQKSRKSALSP